MTRSPAGRTGTGAGSELEGDMFAGRAWRGPLRRPWSLLAALWLLSASTIGFSVAAPAAEGAPQEPTTVQVSPTTTLPPKASPPSPLRPEILTGPDSLELVSQTPWAGPSQTVFQLDLRITASNAADETLDIFVYGALTARSEFQAALQGEVSNFLYAPTSTPLPLNELTAGPDGSAEVDISLSDMNLTTGVYPVQIFLEKYGVRVGQPLTTFLVYADKSASDLQALRVAFVFSLASSVTINQRTGTPAALPGATVQQLSALASELAAHRVPVTLAADAPTMEALASSGAGGRSALSNLRSAIAAAGEELLPSTALPVDIPSLVGSSLTSDLSAELAAGSSMLGSLLGQAPGNSTWAFPGGTDQKTLAALVRMGARQVALPETDLSELPPTNQDLTFAQPTKLRAGGNTLIAVQADAELSARVGQAGNPDSDVLLANQVLAELAMVDLEAPSDLRGVVVLPSASSALSATFLSVLLGGLEGNPLLRATTLSAELGEVPAASLTRSFAGPDQGSQLAGVASLPSALSAVTAAGEVFGGSSPQVSALSQQLVVALSSALSGKQRDLLIASITSAAQSQLSRVRLPPPASITLTSHDGRLPLAILLNGGQAASVRLLLSSDELSFAALRFAEGSCTPVGPGSESCSLTLTKSITLQVPVAVRTSGVFQLSLLLQTPHGDTQLASSTDTVRSTATNEVALALMAGALVFLAVWWARNARHGHRARKLVPRDAEDGLSEDDTLPGVSPSVPEGL